MTPPDEPEAVLEPKSPPADRPWACLAGAVETDGTFDDEDPEASSPT